jgi:hypothetical protein
MRTFFPRKQEKVDASSHCEGAQYVIGVGTEMWGTEPVKVLKVQMSYDNKVAGRKAPSFPIVKKRVGSDKFDGCPDFDEVAAKVEKVISPLRRWMITWDRRPGSKDVSGIVCEAIKQCFTLEDEHLERPCHQIRVAEFVASGPANEVADALRRKLRELNAPKGTKIYVARLAEEGDASV